MKKIILAIACLMTTTAFADHGATWYDNSNTKYMQMQAPAALTQSYRLIVPTTPGTVGQTLSITAVNGSTLTTSFTAGGAGGGTSLGFILKDTNAACWATIVSTTGNLNVSSIPCLSQGYLAPNAMVIPDNVGAYWTITMSTTGHINIAAGGSFDASIRSLVLTDSNNVTWIFSVDRSGHLIVNDGTQTHDVWGGVNGIIFPPGPGSIGQCVYQVNASSWGYTTCGAGGGTWGSITGTLSNQTDLQTALNNVGTSTAAIQSQVTTNTASIAALVTSTTSLQTQINTNTASIATLTTSTTSLQTQVNTINTTFASSISTGILKAQDWNTFNNKGAGTVTSVTGSAGIVSSGGATPNITMAPVIPQTETFTSSVTVTSTMTATAVATNGPGPGSWAATEGSAPAGVASQDILYADSTTHSFKMINNNGTGTGIAPYITGALATIQATTVGIGTLGYCSSGCSTDALCVSTGTINSFVRTSARTTACQ